jgi:hypothetical protein
MDPDLLYSLWPLALAIGLAIFTVSFVIPEAAPAKALRILAFVAFILAAAFAIPGIA